MQKMLIFVMVILFALVPFAGAHAADVYAESMTSASSNVLTPSNAVGAPDGAYADFRDGGSTVTLDMGQDVSGDLSLTVYLLQFGARYLVTFYDASWDIITTGGDSIPVSTTTVTATNTSGVAYRYVRVASDGAEQWRLDAVMATGQDEATTEEDTPAEEPTEEPTGGDTSTEPPSPSMLQGTLIKSDAGTAVYILGLDGYRHAFPTEREFISWSLSFDDVETVDDATLAAYSLGGNVTIRPGTYLVKLQTNPKVFAVEPSGILRWVSSESVAIQLYGTDWASRVVDVSDAFWGNYTVGENIETAVHSDGTVLTRSGIRYYVVDATVAELDDEAIATLRLSDDFDAVVNATLLSQYASGVISLLTEGAQWPY